MQQGLPHRHRASSRRREGIPRPEWDQDAVASELADTTELALEDAPDVDTVDETLAKV